MNNEIIKAIIRLIVTFVLALNAILTAKGINPIPFDEAAFTEWVTYLVAAISALWVWWKNNNITKEAQQAQEYLDNLKEDKAA